MGLFESWLRQRRLRATYQSLLAMDDRILADIGVARATISELVASHGSKPGARHE